MNKLFYVIASVFTITLPAAAYDLTARSPFDDLRIRPKCVCQVFYSHSFLGSINLESTNEPLKDPITIEQIIERQSFYFPWQKDCSELLGKQVSGYISGRYTKSGKPELAVGTAVYCESGIRLEAARSISSATIR